MNVEEALRNSGMTYIPNPLYNPKSKKNTQPAMLPSVNIGGNIDPFTRLAITDLQTGWSATEDETRKYNQAGYTYNPRDVFNMDRALAENQSAFKKFGNALAQTIVSEIGLGTIKGFSDLFDLIGSKLGITDKDYSNPLSAYLEEKQEEFRNYAPIYSDPTKNIFNGGLLDAGWWASNIPSIASTLTLMLPGMGVAKGLSYVGKASKVGATTKKAVRAMSGTSRALRKGKTLNKIQRAVNSPSTANKANLLFENGVSAATMRAVENYQEARQTYNDVYANASETLKNMSDEEYQNIIDSNEQLLKDKNVDVNDRDAVAKAIAEASADVTFQTDWLNVGWDVLQMYALKNAWKGIKNAKNTSASVRRKDLDSRKYFGKTEEEIKALKAKRPFKEKSKEWIEDRLYGSKIVLAAEASEGAEEALNYVAQQEGLNFGQVLLGKEKGNKEYSVWKNVFNGFDGRLAEYIQAPELWDSAFWGVMGGVVFQGLGSQFRRLANKITDKSEANKESQEDMPWYQLDELPENKRRIREINARTTDAQDYVSKLERINNGEDIYKSTNDKVVKFDNPVEQAAAREKLKKEFITKMTIRAMHSGNLDMLKAWLADENIRKGFIETGVFGKADEHKTAQEIESESKSYIDDALRQMEKIEQMYEQELIAVEDAAANIDYKNKLGINSTIPSEYLQIIATNNVYNMLGIENSKADLDAINQRIGELHEQFADKLDPAINYGNNIKLGMVTWELGTLRAEHKKLANKKNPTLSDKIALNNIEKRIEAIENTLDDTELVWATFASLRFTRKELSDGKYEYIQEDTPEAYAYRDRMITKATEENSGSLIAAKDLGNIWLNTRSKTILGLSEVGRYKILEENARKTFSELRAISPQLDDAYQRKAAIELSLAEENSSILRTPDEVGGKLSELHNTMNGLRQKAVDSASNTIMELYRNNKDAVSAYVYDLLRKTNLFEQYRNSMSESDITALKEAIDVLDITKGHNRALLDDIVEMFKIIDNIEASKVVENPTNENQDLTESSVPIDDNSSLTNETNTADQTGQNQPIPEQIDAQKIDKRKLKSTEFFSNANEVDIFRPFEVVEYPIATRNAKGKLVISKPGILVNTDTLEYREQKALEEQQGQVEEGIEDTTSEELNNNVNEAKIDDNVNTNPSTGEREFKTQSEAKPAPVVLPEPKPSKTTPITDFDVVPEGKYTAIEIQIEATAELIKAYNADKSIDLDAKAEEIINRKVNEGVDRTLAETAINKGKDSIKRRIAKNNSNSEKTMQSTVDEVVIAQSIVTESERELDAVTAYKEAVKQMIIQYAKERGIKETEGKYYINLEDLLRYVNSVTDPSTSTMIYNSLLSYLKTDEAKKEFIIMDEDEANSSDFLTNVQKTEEERYNEKLQEGSVHKLDINKVEDDKDFEQAYDELEVGSKLTAKQHPDDSNSVLFLDEKGRAVGTAVIPRIDSATGAYRVYTNDWAVDVLDTKNGIISKLKDLFLDWFTSDNPSSIELQSIIRELTYTKPSKERKQELLEKFRNNQNIKDAKANGFVNKDHLDENLINGLVSLIKFNNKLSNGINNEASKVVTKVSLNQWFKKLYNSYNFAKHILNDSNSEIIVANISNGDIIRLEANEEAIPANKALAGGVNTNVHKISVVTTAHGTVNISGMSNYNAPGFTSGSTLVYIPNKSGRPALVHAYPASVSDEWIGKDAKDILKTIYKEIDNALDERASNLNRRGYDNLANFFEVLLSNKRSNTSLFRGLTFNRGVIKSTGNNYFTIGIPNTSNFITVYEKNSKGNPTTVVTIGNEEYEVNSKGYKTKNSTINSNETKEFIKTLINNLRFNIAYNYVYSDNHPDLSIGGFARRQKGDFVITIRDKEWRYNSFNEFILNNNLVALRTKPNKDGTSNFTRRSERQKANAVLEVKVVSKTSSPVKDNVQQTQPQLNIPAPSTRNVPINEQIVNILNSDSKDKGVDILKILIGIDTAFTEDTLKAFQNLGLLPKNIKFDEKFNTKKGYESYNAEVNPKTGEVTVGTKWLNMFQNPVTRKEAIRKLVHEQLHIKLNKNKGYVRSAKNIYNQFKAALDNNVLDSTKFNVNHLRAYLFEGFNEEEQLEEFLVESLTSEELARALNAIDATVEKNKGRKNLFQKILELMSKVFGWDVRKGSLYEQELNTLRNVMNDNIEDRKAVDESFNIIDKITKDGEQETLTPDERYYRNETNKTLSVRVTTAIEADDDNLDENNIPIRFAKDSPWTTPSTNIGTGVDEFVRDFFLGKLDNMSESELESNYPNVTGTDWSTFREQLEDFRDSLRKGELIKGKNISIVSRDIKASGQVNVKMPDDSVRKLNVSGTLDLLGYDQDGNFYIFDMKTVHSNSYKNDKHKNDKWNRQLQLYKQFLEDRYGIKVEGTYIIPIKVNYPTPKGAKNKKGEDMGGITEYSVKNPELKTDYENPNRSQILANGKDFKEAAPTLQPILKKNPKPGSISYEHLDNSAKAVLDGTVTFETYSQQPAIEETSATTPATEEKVVVKKSDEETSDEFDDDIDIPFDFFQSSVTEITEPTYTPQIKSADFNTGEFSTTTDNIRHSSVTELSSNVPSVQSFTETLPICQQAKFANFVKNGEVRVSCK